jgi:hypothetical protein
MTTLALNCGSMEGHCRVLQIDFKPKLNYENANLAALMELDCQCHEMTSML